ncbi:MAG: hypothetical protein MUF48_12810 [Pirellulaceae bacterium]|nr:hypothetical protein [Pirellulaceae bacterium]
MASRENQGLHIALILLIMLTVGLCVISYVFYAKSETQRAAAEEANNRSQQAQKDLQNANFKVQSLQYMISGGAKTWKQMEEDLAAFGGADASDATMAALRKRFQDDMLLFAAGDVETPEARNYQGLVTFLSTQQRDMSQQLVDLRRHENQLIAEKTQLEQTSAERSQKFEESANKARQDLEAARASYQQDLEAVRGQMEEIKTQITDKDNRIVELTTQFDEQQKTLSKKIEDMEKIINQQKLNLKDLQQVTFETPDGVITGVNQQARVVYIDAGSADNLRLQQTFSVFDKETSSVADSKPKGRIEVTQILGEHLAACRIVEDKLPNIMLPGDVIFTPAWTRGRPVHFAIAGFIDITGDNKSDIDLLASLISLNGGVIDDEVSVQTRYLIEGTPPDAAGGGAATDAEKADFSAKVAAASEIGVDRLSVDKFLSLMGWRADVESVTLGRGVAKRVGGAEETTEESPPAAGEGAAPEFRPRTPPRGTDGAF